MSWSASFIVDENGHPIEDTVTESNTDPEFHQDQYEEALSALWALLRSGVLGHGKQVQVNMSGHGNPDHEPTAGWSNDSLTISLYQI